MLACAEAMAENWKCSKVSDLPADDPPMSEKAYILKDRGGRVLWAGITHQPLQDRVRQHRVKPWFHNVETVCYCVQPTRESARAVEKSAVRCTCPPYNKQLIAGFCPVHS